MKLPFLTLCALWLASCAPSPDASSEPRPASNYGVSWEVENLDTASTEYIRAIELSNQGLAQYASGKVLASIETFSEAIEVHPGIPKLYSNRGNAYFELQNLPKAFMDHQKALELDPDNPNFRYNRGLVLKDLNKPEKAAADFQYVIDLQPEQAYAHNYLGISKAMMGQMDQAEAAFNRAIQLNPNEPEFFYSRSVYYSSTGNTQGQREDLTRCIALDANYPSAHNNLGFLNLQENSYATAITHFTLALENGYDANALYNRHTAYYRMLDYENALADLETLIEHEGEDKQLMAAQFKVLQAMGVE